MMEPAPRRLAFLPAGRRFWLDLATDLAESGVAAPVLWVGDPKLDDAAGERFPMAKIVPANAWRAGTLPEQDELRPALTAFRESREGIRAFDRATKLLDRIDWFGDHRGVTRQLFLEALALRVLQAVDDTRPDALLMAESPHAPATYMLYEIARWHGIEIFSFATFVFAPGILLRTGAIDGPFFARSPGLATPHFDQIARDAVSAATARIVAPDGDEPDYMRRHREREARAAKRGSLSEAGPTPAAIFEADARRPRGLIGLRKLIRARAAALSTALAETADTDLPGDYVFVPLHYEPERTSNPDGGDFHDQLVMIARLRALLPEDVTIVVKEHPAQVMVTQRGHLGRTPAFYRRLRAIAGTHVAPTETPSRDLIAGSRFVASLTGSAALEAALLGRNALTFGACWFDGCPNTHRFEDTPSVDGLLAPGPADADTVRDWLLDHAALRAIPGTVNPSNARAAEGDYAGGTLAEEERRTAVAHVAAALGRT